MKKESLIALIGMLLLLVCCVPRQAQLEGTWEFVGYTDGRVESVFDIDNTICFDGEGNGACYPSNDSAVKQYFSYVLSENHKIAIIIDGEISMLDYSINPKTNRLSLDGYDYRYVSSEVKLQEDKIDERSENKESTMITATPTSTLMPTTSSVQETAEETLDTVNNQQLELAEPGDYILFGRYEQDNNTSNGKEDIEWLVLDKDGDRLLVISKFALDCKPYHTSEIDITWEKCSLRNWLNSTFLRNAFSNDERKMIPAVTITADKNPSYNTDPGNNTTDHVFLLSITEVKKYFQSDEARQCKPTQYAKKNGAYVASNCNCWWWMRSSGGLGNYAAFVSAIGSINSYGFYNYKANGAVRPTLWIDLGA